MGKWREERIGGQRLILGDCLEVMPTLGRVDAVVTDPPYGVGLAYNGINDTTDFVDSVCVTAIKMARDISECVVMTPGNRNCWRYEKPDHQGVFYYPSGGGVCGWGFTCSQPIFYYGKDPYLRAGLGSRADSYSSTEGSEKNGHPCPKPIGQMIWMVRRASPFERQTILDPFMGSGTTLVACQKLGRQGIGIEIDPDYFEIACRRVDEAARQPDLLIDYANPKPEQKGFFDEA